MIPPTLKTLGTLARHELEDSVRSRRVIVLSLLYVAGATAATLLFVAILQKLERQLAETLGVTVASGAGNVTATLWKSDGFRRTLTSLAGSDSLALSLLRFPPLALFYGWLSFAFTPALVMLTSTARIAEEVWSGSARFVLFRTSRLNWCLGKFIGQAIQILGALLLSALGAWLVGLIRMKSFEPSATAWAMLLFSMRAWIYSLTFLGLALAVSQWCSAPNLALAFGFLAMIGLAVIAGVSKYFAGEGWRRIWDLVHSLTPDGHGMDLWWGDAAHLLPACVFLASLAFVYFAAGYARFAKRDL
jgi:ABC-type transport system involved in multi-copper enzyme maturation permease subunit